MFLDTPDHEIHTEIIRQQKEQLEAIIENMSDALITVNSNGILTVLNQAARDLFRPIKDASLNSLAFFEQAKFYDLNGTAIAPENTPIQRVMRGERFSELRLLVKLEHGNYYINISGSPIFDQNGIFQMGILCCRDITDYLKNSKLIGIQKNQLEAIMDNVSELIVIMDTTRRVFYGNKVARNYVRKFCGEASPELMEEIRSKTVLMDFDRNLLRCEDLPYTMAVKTKGPVRTCLLAKYEDLELYFDVAAVPILDESGNIVFVMASANDISEHIRNERQMQKRNDILEHSLHLKDEFLSLISHEFKTPLTVINSAIQAMELICRDELSEKAKGFINKIRQNSYRQIRLVNNLLDITRINAGHLNVHRKNSDIVFLTRAIMESVQLYAGQKNLSLRFNAESDIKFIALDEEKYERILLNLLSNAIKFSPRGKTVYVTVRFDEGMVLVDVTDEGIGIPDDKLDLIFERFGQVDSSLSRQAEGAGIGLSLVKLFVEALNGYIHVKSNVGIGSTFTISLPDKTIIEDNSEPIIKECADNRIVQATVIEFSDIYI